MEIRYRAIDAFKNVQNVSYYKAASDMKVGTGVTLDRVAKITAFPASEDDAKGAVYVVTNISDKPELHNNPETYVVNKGEYVRADDLRTVNGLEIRFAAFEISSNIAGLAAEDLLVFGTDGKIVKVASADGYAVCFKIICRTPYMDDGTPAEIVTQ